MTAHETPGDGRGTNAQSPSPDWERLTRWEAAGGEWRVIVDSPARLIVALLTCDGGEEMGRIASSDPSFVAYVNAREGNEV